TAVVAGGGEDEEEAERGGGGHEESDRDELAGGRRGKEAPRGGGAGGSSGHVPGDREVRDILAGEGGLRPGGSAAPGGVLSGHASDQVAKLGVELRTADRVALGVPSPIELKALAVPGKDGGGPNDDETGAPPRPEAGQPDPDRMKRLAIPYRGG